MKIRVHSWGGLGSQLFTLAVIYEINKKIPNKEIDLVHHTAGVTKRFFELDTMLDSKFSLKVVNDYKQTKDKAKNDSKRLLKKLVASSAKFILNVTRVSINLDTTPNLNRIKPWTLEIRGHYSKRQIENIFLGECLKFFNKFPTYPEGISDALTVHYRLGDLLTITEKSFIAPHHLMNRIIEIKNNHPLNRIIVYSDSIEEAKNRLEKIFEIFDMVNFMDSPTQSVIQSCIESSFFLGTNSKVSIWIVKLRDHLGLQSQIIK